MKKINGIIKSDTMENWQKAKNFIPKDNEIIIYSDIFPSGIKIGNGVDKVNDLPFLDNYDYDVENDILLIRQKEV